MSLATLPAWWWMNRLDWRRVALVACAVFLLANLASAVVTQYASLLAVRFIASLAGGTLMILCISCAAGTPNPSRVYAFWVLGQLLLGMLGLLVLPGNDPPFAANKDFGHVAYVIRQHKFMIVVAVAVTESRRHRCHGRTLVTKVRRVIANSTCRWRNRLPTCAVICNLSAFLPRPLSGPGRKVMP